MKLVGKVTRIDFTSFRYCEECEAAVKKHVDLWQCPNCGIVDWRKTRRRYEISLGLDIFDTQVTCLAQNNVMDQFLVPVGLSLRTLADELAHFRGSAWTIKFREVKKDIDQRLWQKYGGQVVKLYTKPFNGKAYLITQTKSIDLEHGGTSFIEGTQHELLEVTRSVLSNYEEKLERWGDIPILRYTRNISEEAIGIGVRAPVAEYGKAYHVWVRINDVHMIPTTPIYVGGPHHHPAYVYRIYHTKNWKDNLAKSLKYCVSKEDFLINIVKSSKVIYEGGETLWDLVNRVSKLDIEEGIRILQNHGLLQKGI